MVCGLIIHNYNINDIYHYIILFSIALLSTSWLLYYKRKKIDIKNKFVVVTGASSGIGLASAKELLRHGSKVILVARNKDRLIQITNEFKKDGYDQCYYISADLSKESGIEDCKNSIDQILLESNQITNLNQHVEILINCAGSGNWKFIEDTSFKESQDMMSSPYLAAFNITNKLLKPMLDSGIGTIVNINSPVVLQPWQGCIGYSGSRWALRGFTQSLIMELNGTGINVIEVILGNTTTEYFNTHGITDDSFPFLDRFLPSMSTNDAGKIVLNSIISGKSKVIQPFLLKFSTLFTWYPFSLLVHKILITPASKSRLKKIKSIQNNNNNNKKQYNK